MRKALIIGLMVCVLAVGGIGAAFATGLEINNVGFLGLGVKNIPTVETDYVGFHLSSAYLLPVTVDGVYISLTEDVKGSNAVSVSLRAFDGSELCYYALNDVDWDKGTTYLLTMTADGGTLPTADQVFKVKVVVATNSHYN